MTYVCILYVRTLLDMITIQNQIVNVRSSNYKKLKKRVLSSTFAYGTSITTLYFMTYGAEEGVSAALGFATSIGYLSLLTRSVDNIEKYPVQPQLLIPVGTGIRSHGTPPHFHSILITVRHSLGSSRINSQYSQWSMKK